MKQVAITDSIRNRLTSSGVDAGSVTVFEAIALNTQPLRKRHPLYKDAVAERSLLAEMAAAVARESIPLQLQHNSEILPAGRVFQGEVVDRNGQSELRVLFFIDNTEAELIRKVETGTVDQVSVLFLPKQLLNSKSGFDYFGKDADFEHLWTRTDPEGNTLGEDGVFARMVGLDQWFELSLVSQGGANNARIVSRDESFFGSSYQRLAASGIDPNHLVLVATTRNPRMDLTELVTQLTNTKVELATSAARIEALQAELAAAEARATELAAELEAARTADSQAVADLTAALDAKETGLATATDALKDVAKVILTAAGKVDAEIPAEPAALKQLIDATTEGLAAKLVAGGAAQPADAPAPARTATLSAFRRAK